MTEKPHSRRRFLKYAGAGVVAAAAGMGYLTRDYWSSLLKGASISRPTTNQTQQPITNENLILAQTTTTATTTSVTTITTESVSEDEKTIRKLLTEDWVAAFNSGKQERILSLYTEDAILSAEYHHIGYRGLTGDRSLSWYFGYLFEHDYRIINSKIVTLKILDNEAEAYSFLAVQFAAAIGYGEHSEYKLRKITEITRGNITIKLPKPIWKIYAEHDAWIY